MVDPSVTEQIEYSSRGIGSLVITKVEPVVTRTPVSTSPAAEFIEMPPIGFMNDRVGIGKRLDHASPSRFKGHSQTVLVKITTDQGLIGWGEAHAPAAPAVHAKVITDLLAPILLGQDARNIGPLWEKMYSSQRLRGYACGHPHRRRRPRRLGTPHPLSTPLARLWPLDACRSSTTNS